MKINYKYGFFFSLLILFVADSFAQTPARRPMQGGRRPGMDSAMTGSFAPRTIAAAPKPYKDVITSKMVTSNGFFKVHRDEDKVYFEIPEKYFDRDILIVARVIRAANKASGGKNRGAAYGNDEIGESLVAFTKGPKNKIFIKSKSVIEVTKDSSGTGLGKALVNNGMEALQASFDVKAYTPDSTGVVIDMTEFLNGDNDIFFFDKGMKKREGGLTSIEPDRSYIMGINAYPINIEIKTFKSYRGSDMNSVSYELNSSMVLLPEKPMQARYVDPRVGYFNNRVIDYNVTGVEDDIKGYAARWRLEPRPEDMEKYKRGELVEPMKPIIIYIDPATPKKWVPYLIAGINDWQVAFEQAGFKNAILAKEAPVGDSTWSLENALYSALVYKPSNVPNASGPHISDPRSGEIIETHINWFHNVMSLLYNWYFVQCSNVDSRARKPASEFDEVLMGNLIRFVSSHEVGHTLGLMHNFGSSNTVPVELLRNKAWVEANGHTPSIMDYARFNYVAQPEDNVGEKGLFPRIGAYDKWAIEWGYKLIPEAKSAEEEVPILNRWVTDSLKANHFLVYGAQGMPDPRNQSEVLSDDPMVANAYGIKNLKAIMPHILDWTKEPGIGYENAKGIYAQIFNQYQRYVEHVTGFIRGSYITYDYEAQPKVEMVPVAKQEEALNFLNEQVLKTPVWLLDDPNVFANYGYLPEQFILLQDNLINDGLLGNDVIEKMALNKEMYPDAFSVTDYLNKLTGFILGDVLKGQPVNEYQRRNLQRTFIQALSAKINPNSKVSVRVGAGVASFKSTMDKNSNTGITVKLFIQHLITDLKKAVDLQKDEESKQHLMNLEESLETAMKFTNKGKDESIF